MITDSHSQAEQPLESIIACKCCSGQLGEDGACDQMKETFIRKVVQIEMLGVQGALL